MEKFRFSSGSPWEDIVGYSRAVRVGNIIEVAGTTAILDGKVIGMNSYSEQTDFIIRKIGDVLIEAGSSLNDVIRSRIYVRDISKWEEVAAVHGKYFKIIKPASTMVEVSRLISDDLLVEIEVTAVAG